MELKDFFYTTLGMLVGAVIKGNIPQINQARRFIASATIFAPEDHKPGNKFFERWIWNNRWLSVIYLRIMGYYLCVYTAGFIILFALRLAEPNIDGLKMSLFLAFILPMTWALNLVDNLAYGQEKQLKNKR